MHRQKRRRPSALIVADATSAEALISHRPAAAAAHPANAPAAQVREPDADARPEDRVPSEARCVVVRGPPCGGGGQVACVRHVGLVGEDDRQDDAVDGRRLAENDAAGGGGKGWQQRKV